MAPGGMSHWLRVDAVQPAIPASGRIRVDDALGGRQTMQGERLAGHRGLSVCFSGIE